MATSEPSKTRDFVAADQPTAFARRAPAMWRRYLALTKPKVVALITFTAIVGTLLASPGLPPAGPLLWGNLGIALAVGPSSCGDAEPSRSGAGPHAWLRA